MCITYLFGSGNSLTHLAGESYVLMVLAGLILLGGLGFVLGVIYAVWFDRHTAKKNDTVYTITGYAPGQGHA